LLHIAQLDGQDGLLPVFGARELIVSDVVIPEAQPTADLCFNGAQVEVVAPLGIEAKDVALLALPDLVAIDGVLQEKGEVGKQLKGVARVKCIALEVGPIVNFLEELPLASQVLVKCDAVRVTLLASRS
jgi:hypothetical protein